jgi:glucosyl-dolichyl phosphate glucuronosyltransferase
MTCSVIVATKNRPKELSTLLMPTLLTQTRPPEQIVFVDQSSDDSTKKVVESFQKSAAKDRTSAPKILYIYETHHCGAASARNSAIEQAETDILVFLDDDVLLDPDFLEQLLAVYQEYPDVGGVSGVVINYSRPSLPSRIMRRLFWIGPFHDERQPIYWNAERLRTHKPFQVRKFGSGVMSVKRTALKGDRFDARYRGAGAEDVDLSWRVSERHPLLMTPKARLVHVRTETGRARDHWLRYDALSNYYLYRRIWSPAAWYGICFAWLNVGYALLATLASVRRFSLDPWRALRAGVRDARAILDQGSKPSK